MPDSRLNVSLTRHDNNWHPGGHQADKLFNEFMCIVKINIQTNDITFINSVEEIKTQKGEANCRAYIGERLEIQTSLPHLKIHPLKKSGPHVAPKAFSGDQR